MAAKTNPRRVAARRRNYIVNSLRRQQIEITQETAKSVDLFAAFSTERLA